MGTTGVIFAAIAIAWLAYLVPHFARRREGETDEVEPAAEVVDRFSESMRIIRHGTAPLLDQDLAEIATYEVSTPLTRQAAVNDLRRLEALAALRRRRVLLVLLAVISLTVGLCAVDLLPWWVTAIPGGLLVGFVVVARISVSAMHRHLSARYREISQGSSEKTVFLARKEIAAGAAAGAAKPASTAIGGPAKAAGGLWDPVPITMPTYVSKPLAPRTVRTIDLSGPGVTSSARRDLPVTADAPGAVAPEVVAPARRDEDGEAQAVSA